MTTASLFKVKKFYPYPAYVQWVVNDYDENTTPCRGDIGVKRMFNALLGDAEEKAGRKLMDNKVAIEIEHEPTGSVMYIGYKDNKYYLGLGVLNS